MSHVTRAHELFWFRLCSMGWLQSVRSIKLQFSFADCLLYRALSQKRPICIDPTNRSHPVACQSVIWSCKRVMSHISTSHGARINESCHTYQRAMLHVYMVYVFLRYALGRPCRPDFSGSPCVFPYGIPHILRNQFE